MRMITWLLAFCLLMGTASALESYSAVYDLSRESALVKVVAEGGQLDLAIPRDSVVLNSSASSIYDAREAKHLLFDTGENFAQYATRSHIEKAEGYFFILDISEVTAGTRNITVILPVGASLKYALGSGSSSLIPAPSDVGTDGQRIIIRWQNDTLVGNALLVRYNLGGANNYALLLILLLVAALGFAATRKLNHKGGLTRNLFEDERAIVELLSGGELWQKQLQIKSGISKVKLSRKLRTLEQKGLIEKIPYGNTNKIRLKR